jgi:polyisoprenoid-binding protein YceI
MSHCVRFLSVVSILMLSQVSHASTWNIDPAHTKAQFAVRHLMVSTVRGSFPKVSGTIQLDEHDFTKSTIQAALDANSLDTGVEKRDQHLKSPDFFDVAKYPTLTFISKKIQKVGDGQYDVTGDLTMHGVTKEVMLKVEGQPKPFRDPNGMMRIGGMATTKINRKEFGLTWNQALETGGVLIGDDVTITIDVELVQKP